ncbi:MAG: hypothetical protein K9G48_14125 [Reyranella sp.]|nr:hypothetical protein [Reyranella sp.]
MALDVYVGSLTRYYANVGYRIAHADTPADSVKDPARITPAILAWRTALSERLCDNIPAPLDWEESLSAPHFTGRPGWDGLGALVLWAAYAEHPALQLPDRLREEWENDVALARSTAEGFRSHYSQVLRNVELWLPSSFQFTFDGEDVSGRRIVMGSALTLRRQLDELNGATWKAGTSAVDGWRQIPPAGDASLEQCARFGFAVMVDAAQRAIDLHLPVKLDY